ncbi:MAG TPA: hypothetical protein VE326_00640, partial [Candidatus Binatia bacterium]|nr:hypothetical protein [Candidatus Binatia bacterium]
EVDARRAYAGAGYPSLFAYCVEELRFSEDASYKRIQAARAARLFPVLFEAVADGRLHLTAVCMLAPHLNPQNLDELIRAATHRKKIDLEAWLTVRFPEFSSAKGSALVSSITPVAARSSVADGGLELALEQVASHPREGLDSPREEDAPEQVRVSSKKLPVGDCELALEQVADVRIRPEYYLVRVTIGRATHDKLRYAQALLSHAVPSGDVAQVLDRALDVLIARLERKKLGAARLPKSSIQDTEVPTDPVRAGTDTRYIPTQVRRAAWERDAGRCSFVGLGGHRCESRRFLEFDHAEPFARGGAATVEGLRLRCRAHNQFAAERDFGAEFMRIKRNEARASRRNAPAQRFAAAEREADQREAAHREQAKDLMAGLRGLGCRADEARRATEYAMTIEGATFEDRLRAALSFRSHRTATRSKFTEACQVRERRARYGPLAWERRGSDTRPFERPGRRGSSNVTGWALCRERALRSTMPACEPRAS